MEELDIMTFHDENGVPQDFEYHGTVEHKGEYYLFLHPVGPQENDDDYEIMILHIDMKDGKEAGFDRVTDTALFNELVDVFNAMDELSPSVLDQLIDGDDHA